MASRMVVGLMGLGVIGSGVWRACEDRASLLAERVGRPLLIKKALVRDAARPRPGVPADLLTTEPRDILADDEVEIVVEVLGGERPAYDYVKQALAAGKHVVTANKELLAKHGQELFALAQQRSLELGCEASVGGGIPIIAALRKGLAANRIVGLRGIVNGTTNYILTEMAEKGRDFAAALSEAQALGYAEPDPTNDVEGYDARYKLAVLCGLAFGAWPRPEEIPCRGITRLAPADLTLARELGYAVKLLAAARPRASAVEASVQPALVPFANPLAGVAGVFNAVQVQGDLVGDMLFYGRGAGPEPTASAILADVIAVARGERSPLPTAGERVGVLSDDAVPGRHYLRVQLQAHGSAAAVMERLAGGGLRVRDTRLVGAEVAFLVEAPGAAAVRAVAEQLLLAPTAGHLAMALPVAD